jgi:hypothetical protein
MGLSAFSIVTRGLDPRVHHSRNLFVDGLPGHPFENALRAFARQ